MIREYNIKREIRRPEEKGFRSNLRGDNLWEEDDQLIHKLETLLNIGELGEAYDKCQKALIYLNQELEKFKIAKIRIILGQIFEAKGNYKQAYKEYTEAEEIYEHLYDGMDFTDISFLYTRLAILGFKLEREDITKKYLFLHFIEFGKNHPGTLRIVRFLSENDYPMPELWNDKKDS